MSDTSDDFGPIENIPAVMVSYDLQIAEGRIIRFNTGIAQSAPAAEWNKLLDKMTSAADRLEARHLLEQTEQRLKLEEKTYIAQQEDFVRLDAEQQAAYEKTGRRGEFKLTGAQLKDRENAETSIKRRAEMIKDMRDHLAKLKAKAALNADGAANSH